jgi:hypothetical protein
MICLRSQSGNRRLGRFVTVGTLLLTLCRGPFVWVERPADHHHVGLSPPVAETVDNRDEQARRATRARDGRPARSPGKLLSMAVPPGAYVFAEADYMYGVGPLTLRIERIDHAHPVHYERDIWLQVDGVQLDYRGGRDRPPKRPHPQATPAAAVLIDWPRTHDVDK